MFGALGSASCEISHETGGTFCYVHWILRRVISHTRQQDWNTRNPESLPASLCESHGCAGHMKYAPSGTNSVDLFIRAAGLIFLCHIIVLSHGVLRRTLRLLLVRVLSFCVLLYHTRDRGYDLVRALGSASWDIAHETASTICYRLWDLHLLI